MRFVRDAEADDIGHGPLLFSIRGASFISRPQDCPIRCCGESPIALSGAAEAAISTFDPARRSFPIFSTRMGPSGIILKSAVSLGSVASGHPPKGSLILGGGAVLSCANEQTGERGNSKRACASWCLASSRPPAASAPFLSSCGPIASIWVKRPASSLAG
jgi:hypothetical protein